MEISNYKKLCYNDLKLYFRWQMMENISSYYLYILMALVLILTFYVIRLQSRIRTLSEKEGKLIKEAYFHPVTQLPNKRNIKYVFEEQIDRTLRHNQSFTVLAIKVNNYESVEEKSEGLLKKYLCNISDVILHSTRDEDLIAHVVDDVFIVLFNEYLEGDNYQIVMERLQKGFTESADTETNTQYDVSMGISQYPTDGTDSEVLIEKAIFEAVSKQF